MEKQRFTRCFGSDARHTLAYETAEQISLVCALCACLYSTPHAARRNNTAEKEGKKETFCGACARACLSHTLDSNHIDRATFCQVVPVTVVGVVVVVMSLSVSAVWPMPQARASGRDVVKAVRSANELSTWHFISARLRLVRLVNLKGGTSTSSTSKTRTRTAVYKEFCAVFLSADDGE